MEGALIRGWASHRDDVSGGAVSEIVSSSELMGTAHPPIVPIVAQFIPPGIMVLSASPKAGKTFMMLHVAVCVATGRPVFGHLSVTQGSVLYVYLEGSKQLLQQTLGKVASGGTSQGTTPVGGASVPGIEGLDFLFQMKRLDEGGLEELDEWLCTAQNPRMIVIDVIGLVWSKQHADNTYSSEYRTINQLGALARKHGVAIVCIHHTRKAGARNPLDKVSGSHGLTGAADSVAVLERAMDSNTIEIEVTGRYFPHESIVATYDATANEWAFVGTVRQVRMSAERREVIDIMEDHGGPMSPRQVAVLMDSTAGATRKLMRSMAIDGQLEKRSRGEYILPGQKP